MKGVTSFASPSGGRSIRSNCSRLSTYVTTACTSGTSLCCLGAFLLRCSDLAPSRTGPSAKPGAKPQVQRYGWERPGDLIHVDVKTLARLRKVRHRITGNRQQGRHYCVGYGKVPVAVDGATRLAFVEVLVDEKKPTLICLLSRANAWLNSQGIECRRGISDNGPTYV